MDQDPEPELNIQYRETAQKEPNTGNNTATESKDSENAPLPNPTRTLGKIIPSKLEITLGDKTSTVIYGRKQLARKSIARKAPEPRGTLKPQWNIIENGFITNYSPHTITKYSTSRRRTIQPQKNRIHRKEKSKSTTTEEKNPTKTRYKHKKTATKTASITMPTKTTHNATKRNKKISGNAESNKTQRIHF